MGITACLMSDAQTYPSWRLDAKMVTINIVLEKGTFWMDEIATNTAEPRNRIGSKTMNLKRTPSIDPISMLQIASIIM